MRKEKICQNPSCGNLCYNKYCWRCAKKNKYRVGRMKGTKLKKCLNPKCEYYYYGTRREKYCSVECAKEVNRKSKKKTLYRWREKNPDKWKAIERRSYLKRKKNEGKL